MKIIHCADLHLDSKMEGLPPEKSKLRREETLSTFERLCAFANSNGVKAVIIAGDMFDTERVTVKTRERVIRAVKSAEDVDFLYLSGNHDDKSFIGEIELPSNFKVFGRTWTSFRYGNVNISGIVTDNRNADAFYDGLLLNREDFNVVVLHGQIAGYKSRNQAEIISIPRLKEKNIDYLALGHIHEYSCGVIDDRGVYVYSGCLEGRGFDETGDKGFVLLDTEKGKDGFSFIDFAKRKLYEYNYNVENDSNFFDTTDKIRSEVKEKFSASSLLKIVIGGKHNADYVVDKDMITERLSGDFFFVKTVDKTELSIKKEDYENDKTILGEFVREVMESDMENQVKSKVIMCGIKAFKGEEL